MIQRRNWVWILLMVVTAWFTPTGSADPATLLLQEQRGGIQLTVWMDPIRPQPGRLTLKALVQNASDGTLLADAKILSRFEPPFDREGAPLDPVCGLDSGGGGRDAAVRGWTPWSGSGFGNRLLQGIEVWIPSSGTWTLELRVGGRGRAGEFRVGVPVAPSGWVGGMLLWGIGLPALVVALYSVAKSRGHGSQGKVQRALL